MEIVDVVNKNDQVIGSASLQDCHTNSNLIHRVVHFTLVDPTQQKVLITQRSLNNRFDAGLWCFAGEHVKQQENYHRAVERGLKEEFGLTKPIKMINCGHTIFRSQFQTEMARFFVGEKQQQELDLDENEIKDYQWLTLKELKQKKRQFTDMTKHWIEACNWNSLVK